MAARLASRANALGTKQTNENRSANASSTSGLRASTSERYRLLVMMAHSVRPAVIRRPCFTSRSCSTLRMERRSMSRPSHTSSMKACVAPRIPSSVRYSVRPVSVSTLKSTGPTRSVCTVDSDSCLAKRDGCPESASRMRPNTEAATALLAVPGGPTTSTCSRHSSPTPT